MIVHPFWIPLEPQTENPLITIRRAENSLQKAGVIDCICSPLLSLRDALQVVLQETLLRLSSCKQSLMFLQSVECCDHLAQGCIKAQMLQQRLLVGGDRRRGSTGDQAGKGGELHAESVWG